MENQPIGHCETKQQLYGQFMRNLGLIEKHIY